MKSSQATKTKSKDVLSSGMARALVIFDFDGVIADAFDQVWGLFQEFFARHNFTKVSTKTAFRNLFFSNFYESTEALGFDICHTPELQREMKEALHERYNPRIFAGMKKSIQTLADTYCLAIESSNYHEPLVRVLRKECLEKAFTFIVGADEDVSKTKRLKKCIEAVKPHKVLFVTDTVGDIKEAKAADIPVVAVAWGYQSYPQLKKEEPLAVVRTPQELVQTIRRYFEQP